MSGDIAKFKNGFLDRGVVKAAMRGVGMGALSSTMAYTRTVSRNSMRKGRVKGGKAVHSAPGKPPFYWGDGLVRRHTYFAFDTATDSFVAGAAQLGRSKVPNQLEYSDTEKRIEQRPAIRPAFEKARARLDQRLAQAGRKAFSKGRK